MWQGNVDAKITFQSKNVWFDSCKGFIFVQTYVQYVVQYVSRQLHLKFFCYSVLFARPRTPDGLIISQEWHDV